MYAVIAEPPRAFLSWGSKIEIPSTKLLPSRLLTLENGWKHMPSVQKHIPRCKSRSRVRALFIIGPNRKSLKVSAFKSNGQNDVSGGKPSASNSMKKPVGLSYAPPESNAMSAESPETQSVPTYASVAESAGSLAIHNLFKSWLMLLHTPSLRPAVDETSTDSSGTECMTRKNDKTRIVKAAWCYVLALDAIVKMPLLIFVPWYLAVNLMYGPEIAKELSPLWIFGPLIVALYIKLLQSICALYAFSFKQSVTVLRKAPIFYHVAYNYTFSGQFKENVEGLLQPLVDIKNMDYKEAFIGMLKKLKSLFAEIYMDFVESVWPFYCRTIRFLKRAHFI